MSEHYACGDQKRRGVCDSLPGNVRSRAVNRFKDRALLADIGTRCEAESADQSGAKVRHNIAVQILQNEHVELLGLYHQLHTAVINDLIIGLYIWIFLCDI